MYSEKKFELYGLLNTVNKKSYLFLQGKCPLGIHQHRVQSSIHDILHMLNICLGYWVQSNLQDILGDSIDLLYVKHNLGVHKHYHKLENKNKLL